MRPVSPARRRAEVAAVFDRVADSYDNTGVPWFQPIARRLVEQVAPVPGERALDLGCGRGAALFALADAVGPAGTATGIDLSVRMVEATRVDARARGYGNVEVHVMDAGAPTLPAGGYDIAVASFVLFFLPAPVTVLRAWRALLVPGGRLAVSTFTQSRTGVLADVFRPYLPDPLFGSAFETDAGVEGLVASAGFVDVRTYTFDLDVVFDDVDQWQAWSWSHGQRAVWERVPVGERDRVCAAAARHLAGYRDDDGRIRLPQRIRCTLARCPG